MKRAIFLCALLGLFACSGLWVAPGVKAAPAACASEEEIPWETVSNLLHQFTDYVPYSYEQLVGFYNTGRVTITPYAEGQWEVQLSDDGGLTVAILEDNF